MKKILPFLLLITVSISFAQTATQHIRLNQVGFLPFAQKNAVIVDASATTFSIYDTLNNEVFTNQLGTASVWASSGESAKIADFSIVSTPGVYTLRVPGGGESVRFTISDTCFTSVNNAIVKAFYFNRASTPLLAAHAGKYARPAGHPDTIVIVLPSAAGPTRIAGDTIRAAKGWYDAGDYNKYIINSGITTGTLLQAYERYTAHFDTVTWNIPESGNTVPDLLDEIKWNLDWMLTMQDPADGGVYNKTTEASFCGAIMPASATGRRYVVAKGTAAALDFAAVMAMAARVYKPFYPSFADSCLAAAEYAWDWAVLHPTMAYTNPGVSGIYPAVTTGGYGDNTFSDERTWAATELFITTNNESKYASAIDLSLTFDIPMWRNVGTLCLYSLYTHRDSVGYIIDTAEVKTKILAKASTLLNAQSNSNPYKVSLTNFTWGSNGDMSNHGIMLLFAYDITKDLGYFNAALSAYDYILGRNATEFSFVCEFGGKSSANIHHRPSQADSNPRSIPGFLAGGPYSGSKTDCASPYSTYAAKAYLDQTCSFTTNEIAINWQAPLVFMSNGIVAEYKKWVNELPANFAIVSSSHIELTRTQASSSFLVMTNTNVHVATDDTWYTLTPSDITSSGTITITVTEFNEGDSIRNGELYVIIGTDTIKTISIAQKGRLTNFRLEAEDYVTGPNVGTEGCTDVEGGLNVGWIDNEDYMTYSLDITQAGTYEIGYRVSSLSRSGKLYMMIGDTSYSTILTSPTGGWQIWTTVLDSAYFEEGIHEIRIYVSNGGFNMNYMDFALISTENIAPEHEQVPEIIVENSITPIVSNTIYIANPIEQIISVYGLQSNTTYSCKLYSLNGTIILNQIISSTQNTIPVTIKPGTYMCVIESKGEIFRSIIISL